MPKQQRAEFEDERRWPVETIPVEEIESDSRVCPRERIDPSVVAEYSERMQEGDLFPPLTVFCINQKYLLASGFLRLEAAKLAGTKTIRCEVRKGGLRDAVLFSAGCNTRHGHRRTWGDKRKVVGILLGDAEWRKWSDREIARRCSVSPPFVAQLRSELTVNVVSDQRRYTTKHGSTATMTITAIGKRQDAAPSVALTGTERTAEIVRLSEALDDQRSAFIAVLVQMEKALIERSAQSLRSSPSADVALSGRMRAVAQRLLQFSKSITRPSRRSIGRSLVR